MLKRHMKTKIMHRAVEAGGMVFFGGIVADDLHLGMKEQTRQILDKVDSYLHASGSYKSHIVHATVYLTDMKDKPALNEVWMNWFDSNDLPARATIGGAVLSPGARLEIVFTAVKL